MKKIVQKFGGTSLDTLKKRECASKYIKEALKNKFKPVIVVSAMGRTGKPYATDTLISKAEEIYHDINPREKDLLMSCGEIISAVIMVQSLEKMGVESVALTGAQAGIITDDNFGNADIIDVIPEKIEKIINEGKVPVIAGFQGVTKEGDITTLGRGGSDTTASIIAEAIKALYIEIYTDVAGVMTADPKKVKNPKILNKISYTEVCELAYQGARVIHPRAAEIAMKNGIPIKVKSTLNKGAGTLIHKNDLRGIKSDKPVTGITSRNNILFVIIKTDEDLQMNKYLNVFNILAKNNISVDFINIRPEAISFIVDFYKKQKLDELLSKNNFKYLKSDDFVKVSIVGGGMTGRPGVMAKLVKALNNADVEIYQTTDSHTTISCLVKKEMENLALNTLHDAFELNS
ncbi:aspartate kinase [Natronospora cellulosivora (SeqCode)]